MADIRQPVFYMDMREKVLRGVLIVISICALICVHTAYCVRLGFYGFYIFTSVMSMLSSVMLFVFVLLKLELLFTRHLGLRVAATVGDLTLAYLSSGASMGVLFGDIECIIHAPMSGRVAAGVFGFFGVTISGILAVFGVMDIRKRKEEESRPIMQVPPHP